MISDEMDALSGPLRRAFAAIAAVDNLETRRSTTGSSSVGAGRHCARRSPPPTSVVVGRSWWSNRRRWRRGRAERELVEASREGSGSGPSMFAGNYRRTSAKAQTAQAASMPQILLLLSRSSRRSGSAGELSGEVDDDLVDTLHKLSRADEPEVVFRAIEALASVHPPGDVAFWIGLAQDAKRDRHTRRPVRGTGVRPTRRRGSAFGCAGQIGPIAEVGDIGERAVREIMRLAENGILLLRRVSVRCLRRSGRISWPPGFAGIEPVSLGRPWRALLLSNGGMERGCSGCDQSHPAVASQSDAAVKC